MLHSVKEIAHGKGVGILATFGLTDMQLSGKHTSCPCCGGKDRFRLDNKEGRGTFFCSFCGAGDGVELVKRIRGIDFKQAALEIEKAAGFVRLETQKAGKTDEQKLTALKRVWNESKALTAGDEVSKYLTSRGLIIPDSIRQHSSLYYRDENETGKFTAMIAKIQAVDGRGVSIHRTYLQNGAKAKVKNARMNMEGLGISGAAIRLFNFTDVLGVAEGIESSIAARMIHNIPTWSCISANGLAGFEVPDGVKRLVVFADNDKNFTGQQAAYTLARRCELSGIRCDVVIPPTAGTDWADEIEKDIK